MQTNMDKNKIWSEIMLAIDNSWKISIYLNSGESHLSQFITAVDENNKVIVFEKVGERHLPQKSATLDDISSVKVHW